MLSKGKPFFMGSVVGVGLGRFLFASGALAALCTPTWAGPEGQQVVRGNASFSRNGATTTITAGHNSIINYSSFNIQSHESVRFIQPSATSRVLNRVLSADATFINGGLHANGIVYISNPAGIFFGGQAIVNAGSLVAAAGTITNSDFLGGIDRFSGLSGSVENFGTIQAGSVAMVGQFVANHGVIFADKGTVTLAAGDEVYMGPRQGGMYVKIKSDGAGPAGNKAGVENTGHISGGASLLTAGDMYSMAVRNTGTVQGKSIKLEGQGSGVVSVGGTLDASARGAGETGGRVEVTGEKVGLFGATVTADGPGGGGEILVGGDYQGKGSLRNAEATYVDGGSTLSADATAGGDGGTVIVWSDQTTRTYGDLSARGSGDGAGGLVETSGKEYLDVGAAPDVRAASGRGGRWLIDPRNVEIVAGGGSTNINAASPFTPTGDDAQLGVNLITTALGGAGVTVEVNTGATGAQAGNITLSTSLNYNGIGTGDTLRLTAANDIIINGTISDSNAAGDSLNLEFIADNDLSGAGSVTVSQALTLQGGTFSSSGVDFSDAASNITASSFTFNHTGNVTLNNASAVVLGTSSIGGDLAVSTTVGNVSDTGTVTVGGNASFTTTGANDDVVMDQLAVSGSAAGNTGATGNVTLVNATGLNLGAMTVGGNLIATATTGNLTDSGTVTVAGTAALTTGGADDDINTDQLAVAGSIGLSTNGATADATIVNATDIDLSASAVGRTLSATATTGNITDSATLTIGGNGIFQTANAGDDINLGTLAVAGSIGLTTAGAGDAAVTNANGVAFTTTTVGGNLSATATTGNMTDAATVTVGGSGTFGTSASGATITLDQLAAAGVIIANTLGAAGNATLVNATAVNLGGSSVGGNLTVTATTGGVTDSGAVAVGGNGSFTTAQADADIFLDGLAVTGTMALSTNGVSADATIVNATGINFAASSIGRNLAATATTGNITDAGAVTVGLNGTFTTTAANADVALDLLAVAGGIAANTSGAGGDVTITNATAVNLQAMTVGGNLVVVAVTGAITDSGTASVGGNGTFTTSQADADIFVDQLDVAGTVSVNTNGPTADATVTNATDLALAASSVGRNLVATATAGALTDSGTVTVGGTGSFTTTQADADIFLDALAVAGAVSVSTNGAAADATIVNAAGLTLATSGVGRNLVATATTGNLTDSGTLTIGGNATLNTSASNATIMADQLAVTGTIAVNTAGAAGNATIVNATGATLGASTVGGALSVTATTGNITDAGAVSVGGTASFTTAQANDDINLDQLAALGSVALSTSGATGNATVVNATGLTLAASTVGGNLSATATTGNVSDAGAVSVGGTGTFTTSAANADIALDQAAVTGAISLNTTGATGDAALIHATGVTLGASSVGGALSVTATTGNITDSGTVTIGGASTFTAANAGDDITLDQLAAGGTISANTTGAGGNVTLVNATGVDLAALSVGGDLSVTATTGDITDSGTVTVGGNAAFTTLALLSTIDLDQLAVTGAVTFNAAGDLVLSSATALVIQAMTVGGDLTATAATGGITDAGAATVGGDASFTASDGSDIVLDLLNVTGSILLSTAGNAAIVNALATDLGLSNVGGNLDVTSTLGNLTDSGVVTVGGTGDFTTVAAGADVTLNQLAVTGQITPTVNGAGADVTIVNATGIDLNGWTVPGNLSVTATTGSITDSALVTIGGTSSFQTLAANAQITLDTLAATGAIALNTTGALGHATLANLGDAVLAVSAVGGDLSVSSGGGILQTGALDVNGNTDLVAGLGEDVTLTDAGNDFTGRVSVISAADADLRDANALVLGASTITGNLTLTAAGAITQTGALDVAGTTGITAGAANDVTLTNAGNDFVGAVSVVSAQDASLRDANALVLGASTITGNLTLTAAGAITQSGALDVAGTTGITAGAANDVTLTNGANDFGGAVTVSSADSVVLVDADDLTLGNVTASDLDATAATDLSLGGTVALTGNATLDATAGALTIGDLTAAALTATAGTDLSQGAGTAISTTGLTDLTAGDAAALEDLTAGSLAVSAGTDITQAAGSAIAVTGATTLTGGTTAGDVITLDEAANNFGGAVSISAGQDVTLRDANALSIGASTVSGDLTATAGGALALAASTVGGDMDLAAGGAITQSGALTITGASTLEAGANAITLNNAANNFVGSVTVTGGGAVTLRDANSMTLGNVDAASLTATAATGLAQVGGTSIDLTGAANLTATAGAMTLRDVSAQSLTAIAGTSLAHATGAIAVTNAANLTASGGAITLGDLTAGSLTASATTDITQTAGTAAVVTGAADLTATGGSIALEDLAAGSLIAAAGADITQGAGSTVTVSGPTTLSAGTGVGNQITLDQATNNFGGSVFVTSGRDVTLRDVNALALGASTVSGDLTGTAGGAITDTGNLSVAGAAAFKTLSNAGAAITLNSVGNTFGTLSAQARNAADSADAAGTIAVTESGNMDLTLARTAADATFTAGGAANVGQIAAGGDASVTAGGNVTLDSIVAADAVTIAAGGSILEAGAGDGGNAVDIDAESATLTAAGGIGAAAGAGSIETSLGTLTATNSGSGVINILEADAITLAGVTNTGGNVTVRSGGAMQATNVSSSGSALLRADTGDLTVGSVTAATTASLQSIAGSITEIGGGDAGNDVIAATAVLTADDEVGGGAGGALETAASTIVAAGNEAISLTNQGDAAATLTSSGLVNVGIDGTLSTNGSAWAGGSFALRANDVQINDAVNSAGAVTLGRFDSGSIGLGSGAGDMQVAGSELANVTATDLTVGGAGTTAVNVGTLTAAQSQNISGIVTLSAGDAGGTVNFSGDSVFNRLVSASSGATNIADNASIATDVGGLSLTAGSGLATAGDATLSAAGTLTLTGDLAGGGSGTVLTLRGADAALNGLVDVGAGTIVVDRSAPGAISVGAAAGGLRLDGDELSRLTAAGLTVGGANATGITVDGVTGAQSNGLQGINFSAAGAGAQVIFSGADSFFRAMSASGSAGLQVGTDLTTSAGVLAFGSGATLTSDVVLTGQGISIENVDSDVTARALTLNSTGNSNTSINDAGQASDLRALITNADGATTLNGDVTTTQTLAFNDHVLLGTDVAVTNAGAAGITFAQTVVGGHDLTVDAAGGAAAIGGDVSLTGAVGDDGGSLHITALDDVSLGGDVTTTGGAAGLGAGGSGGDVTLISEEGSVEVGAIDTSGTDAASGAGGSAGDVTIAPSNRLEVTSVEGVDEDFLAPVGRILLRGNITAGAGAGSGGADGQGGAITLASAVRVGPDGDPRTTPAVATIVAFGRDGAGALAPLDVVLTGRTISVGQNEKFSSLGGIRIVGTESVRVGDLSAVGDIRIETPVIEVWTRPGADLLFPLSPDRTLLGTDEGVDLVSGGSIQIVRLDGTSHTSLTAVPTSALDTPITLAATDLNNSTVFTGLIQQQFDPGDAEINDFVFDPAAAQGSEIFLDLNSAGSSIQNVATSLAGALPAEARPEVAQNSGLDASQRDEIRQLGITPRDLTPDEMIEFLVGVSLYDDYPPARDAAKTDFTVAVNRLPSDRVTRLLADYRELFYQSATDPETGEVTRTSRTTEIQDSLAQAVRRYRQQPGVTGIEPGAFRAYLEATPAEAEALAWVKKLETFLRDLKQLGLGPREERIAIDELLTPVLPRGINTPADLERVILPEPSAAEPPADPMLDPANP